MDLQQRIRQVVAREHHEKLEPNDPILMTVTMNEVILANYLEQFQAALDVQLQQLETKVHEKFDAFLNADVQQSNSAISAMTSNFEATEKRINNAITERIVEFEATSKKGLQEIQICMKTVNNLLIVLSLGIGLMAGILAKTYLIH